MLEPRTEHKINGDGKNQGNASNGKAQIVSRRKMVDIELAKASTLLGKLDLSPPLLLMVSFFLLIAIGTVLLQLPRMTNHHISFIDALFTATSASCVTGLTVLSTAHDFTFQGQVVIMILMQLGGMSGCYALNGLENRRQYLREVFRALVVRDIQDKYAVRNVTALHKVTDFLVDNIGNLVSVGGIATKLTASSTKITNKTVDNYVKYFCRAFAFYKVKRYDIRGKDTST